MQPYCLFLQQKSKYTFNEGHNYKRHTYRSNADIDGGSAMNSNSGGGSLGTGGSEIVTVVCIRGFGCNQTHQQSYRDTNNTQ